MKHEDKCPVCGEPCRVTLDRRTGRSSRTRHEPKETGGTDEAEAQIHAVDG